MNIFQLVCWRFSDLQWAVCDVPTSLQGELLGIPEREMSLKLRVGGQRDRHAMSSGSLD